MRIKTINCPPIPYRDASGKYQQAILTPGTHEYPQLDPSKDSLLASHLFSLRKLGVIAFDDRLPQDMEIIKDVRKAIPAPNVKGMDKAEAATALAEHAREVDREFARRVLRRGVPVGRLVAPKVRKNAKSAHSDAPETPAAGKNEDTGRKSGGVSDETKDAGGGRSKVSK